MDVEHLVQMSNDIANFFRPASGQEQAAAEIATHMRRFWDPRMRAQLIEHYAAGAAGMLPEVRHAAALLAATSPGAAAALPTAAQG